MDIERSGISMGYFKPQVYRPGHPLEGLAIPMNHWDSLGGKGINFLPGGQDAIGNRGPYAQIFGGLVGRGFELGVARTNPNSLDDGGDIRMSGSDAVNPVSIRLGGTKKKLIPCVIAGANAVCWQ